MYCLQYTKSDELLTPPVIKLAAEDVKKFLPDGVKNFLPTHVKNSLPHDVKKFLPRHVKNSLPCGCKITLPRTDNAYFSSFVFSQRLSYPNVSGNTTITCAAGFLQSLQRMISFSVLLFILMVACLIKSGHYFLIVFCQLRYFISYFLIMFFPDLLYDLFCYFI